MSDHEADDAESPAAPPGALESAIRHLEGGLRADGSCPGDIPEGEHAGYEWRSLFRWAELHGFVFSPEVTPARRGGREHDVTFLESERRWLKFTKPDGCGYAVEIVEGAALFIPATPLQYLRRLRLQNEVWGDDVQLVGVHVATPGARIVTSQPHLKGESPHVTDLDEYLICEHGFRRLDIPPMGYYKSASYLRGEVGMFDVHPANFVETSSGIIVPIDVIMIPFAGADLAFLQGRVTA